MPPLEFELFDRESLFEARKHKLIREAGSQFSQKGFHGTSMTNIASGVKITKSGLFHYVKTKEELLFLCYDHSVYSSEQCLKAANECQGSALDKLNQFIRQHLIQFEERGGYYVNLTELSALSEDKQKKLHNRAKKIDVALNKIIEIGIADGSIGFKNAKLAVHALEGTLNWIPQWYSKKGKQSINEITEDIIELFNHGLKTRN